MKLRATLASAIATTGVMMGMSSFAPVSAASLSFNISNFTGDSAQANVKLTEVENGISFEVNVVESTSIGDLRGVFFNIADDSLLSGLSVSGANLGNVKFDAGNVINLGGGATLSGYSGGNFDAGVEIGHSGIGKGDDFQLASFVLSHRTAVLTLDQFANQYFGVRMTSVGPEGSSRNGSSKLAGLVPVPLDEPDDDSTEVPEPSSIAALGLAAIGAWRLKRNLK